MTAPRRRAAIPLVPILAIAFTLVAAGCGPDAARATPAPSRPSAPDLTPVPGAPGTNPSNDVPTTTTDVDGFGPIRDAVPPSFPRLAGQEPADTGAGPTSGAFAVNMTAAAASAAMQAKLTTAGWSADVGSPLEDGSVVLEATGAPPGCKAEVRFTPTSGTTTMSVLYGASCPAS